MKWGRMKLFDYEFRFIVYTDKGNRYEYFDIEADCIDDALSVVREFCKDDHPEEKVDVIMTEYGEIEWQR